MEVEKYQKILFTYSDQSEIYCVDCMYVLYPRRKEELITIWYILYMVTILGDRVMTVL